MLRFRTFLREKPSRMIRLSEFDSVLSRVWTGPTRTIAFILWAAVMLAGSARASGTPAALVIESGGSIVPATSPYSEIDTGTVLKLGSGGHLVFVDYYQCEQVTVTGGIVRFDSRGYHVTETAHTSHERIPCQHEIHAATAGETAAVVLRGNASDLPHLPARPAFVVVGPHADDLDEVKVSREGKELLSAPIDSRRFNWPATANALVQGTTYELSLINRRAKGSPRTVTFTVDDQGTHGQPNQLVLLRVK